MEEKVKKAIDMFYYHIALGELRRMNKSASVPHISYNSLLYLDIIEMTPDCTASRLADMLHISKPAVTIKVGELIRQGLVEKRQCDKDKRVHYLSINPEAAKELRDFDVEVSRAIAAITGAFSPEQLGTFCAILDQFGQAYQHEETHA